MDDKKMMCACHRFTLWHYWNARQGCPNDGPVENCHSENTHLGM